MSCYGSQKKELREPRIGEDLTGKEVHLREMREEVS
jgi:hypothetical protein